MDEINVGHLAPVRAINVIPVDGIVDRLADRVEARAALLGERMLAKAEIRVESILWSRYEFAQTGFALGLLAGVVIGAVLVWAIGVLVRILR